VRLPRRGEVWIFVAKTSLAEYLRKVDVQTLTNANTMLFKILATPER
jgi:hypothetical protein